MLHNNHQHNNNHHNQHNQHLQQQQQQNSMDMISLKSQNSIDSILSAKSPPISEYAISNYVKRVVPMPQAVKNVAKYPSDSESIASGIMSTNAGAAGSIFHTHSVAHNRHTQLFPSFTQTATHHAIRQIRHSSPLTLPTTTPLPMHAHAGVDIALGIPTTSVDKFDMDYAHQSHNSYVQEYPPPPPPAVPTHYQAHMGGVAPMLAGGGLYEGGTFPRKKEHPRLRIPSNPSVASKSSGVKNSSGSIDHHYGGMSTQPMNNNAPIMQHSAVTNAAANGGGSGRGSPMPQVHVEVLSHGGNKHNSNAPSDFLCPGDLRRVTIEKSDKSLGITIQCNNNGGGIFVSTVADKSIATRAGLQVGDQLLEVCGLNMRSATNDIDFSCFDMLYKS